MRYQSPSSHSHHEWLFLTDHNYFPKTLLYLLSFASLGLKCRAIVSEVASTCTLYNFWIRDPKHVQHMIIKHLIGNIIITPLHPLHTGMYSIKSTTCICSCVELFNQKCIEAVYVSEDVVGSATMTGGSLMLPAVENRKAWGGSMQVDASAYCSKPTVSNWSTYSDPHSWSQWLGFIHVWSRVQDFNQQAHHCPNFAVARFGTVILSQSSRFEFTHQQRVHLMFIKSQTSGDQFLFDMIELCIYCSEICR